MSSDAWKNENTARYNIRITKTSGIPEALEKASLAQKTTTAQYIRAAIVEKLNRDGFPPVPQKSE